MPGVEPSFPPYQSDVFNRWTTGLRIALMIVIDPCGIRTQPNQLERLVTSPEVERAMLCAHRVRRAGQEALESSSADFQSVAKPSQLLTHDLCGHRIHEKSPMSS